MKNSEIIDVLDDITWNGCGRYEKEVMIECRSAAISALEENDKLKAEIEQYQKETSADKIDYAYDLGYQSCLNHSGVGWVDAEEIQKLRKEIEQLKSELEKSDSCDGCKHELERNEYYCDGCKRISVDNFELKSEVSE